MAFDTLKNLTILYAEDDYDTRIQTSSLLKDFCANLYVASHGKEAYEIIKNHTIDMVITDILMPHLGGLELIKKLDEESKRPPSILITTAYSETHYLLQAIDLKVDGFILKPINFHTLLETAEKAAKIKFQEKELEIGQKLIHALGIFVGGKKIEIIRYLIQNADLHNVFNGSYEDVMANVGVSKPTVVSVFKQLSDAGLLVRLKNKRYQWQVEPIGLKVEE